MSVMSVLTLLSTGQRPVACHGLDDWSALFGHAPVLSRAGRCAEQLALVLCPVLPQELSVERRGARRFLYFLSMIKIAVTLAKYVPQVLLNQERRSTSGFSIAQVLGGSGVQGSGLHKLLSREVWVVDARKCVLPLQTKFCIPVFTHGSCSC